MKLTFWPTGWEDYQHWQQEGGKELARLDAIIRDCLRDPFRGLAKPEPLSGSLSGWWSRRITREHRLIYRVTGEDAAWALEIAQCRFHC